MELGLSLGDASKPFGFLDKNIQKKKISGINNGGLGFCMALGLTSFAAGNDQQKEIIIKARKSKENDDDAGGSGGGDDISDDGDAHLQLNLAPVVVPRRISSRLQSSLPRSPDNVFGPSEANSENGGSSAARGLDVNRPPEAAAAEEDVSSENTAGSPLHLDFGVYRNTAGKRDADAAGNDVSGGSFRASDDDENGVNARKKLRLSKEQSAFLEESFKEHSTLNPKQKQALAKQLNLRTRQVEVWFQNRRARTKLKQTEVDCEYLKRCCETLTVENRRLHKELQELRALKTTSNPFYKQLPATTLTMCPSCERVASTAVSQPNAAADTVDSSSNNAVPKATGIPLRYYPFSQTPTHHNNNPAAS